MKKDRNKFFPFILTMSIIIVDQLTKYLVVLNIPENTVKSKIFGDFLWICHVRNTGAAFSLGANSSIFARIVMLIIIPLAFMCAIAWAIVSKKEIFTPSQKWYAAGILGGGIGTIIDRIFRFNEGVVDFISVKFYGLFGLERWPTFNISDSCVVIFVILFAISILLGSGKKEKQKY